MARLLLSGDRVILEPSFGVAMLSGALDLPVQGTAHPTTKGQPLVLQADLKRMVWSVTYTTASHTVPGTGTVRMNLDSIPKTIITTAAGVALALSEPNTIAAELTVLAPASMPGSPPSLDTSSRYSGKARIEATGTAPDAV